MPEHYRPGRFTVLAVLGVTAVACVVLAVHSGFIAQVVATGWSFVYAGRSLWN